MNKNPSATWIGQESCLLPVGESPLSAGMCNSHQKSTYVLKNKFPLVTNPIKVLARVCMLIILPASWHCTLVIYSLHSGAGHIDKSPDIFPLLIKVVIHAETMTAAGPTAPQQHVAAGQSSCTWRAVLCGPPVPARCKGTTVGSREGVGLTVSVFLASLLLGAKFN